MAGYIPKLKICGVASEADAALVGASGADYCGVLMDVAFSERSLTLDRACHVAAAGIDVVLLLCDPTLERALEAWGRNHPVALQLLCHEPPERLRAIKSRCEAVGGLMADVTVPVFLAGGIDPQNVAAALVDVRPHGIEKVTATCPVPIAIAGGPTCETDEETLAMIHGALNGGASGIVMGRNIWQSAQPLALIQAVKALIHDGANLTEAFDILNDSK